MSGNQQFRLAGVMGMPVLQSRSPIIHNHWLKAYGIRGAYGHFPVKVENVAAAVRGLSALGLAGCNITQPHKLMAIGLMDELHPMARKIGAINCIVVRPDGSLHGFNHDWYGYLQSLKEASPGWRADAGPATVLGAGGAARAVLHGLASEGAREIRLINRTRAKAEQLAADLADGLVTVLNWDERHDALDGATLLVNTTNQGMVGQPALDLRLDPLPQDALVSDLIYIPLETPLLKAARERGNLTAGGLGMLLHQAVPAFESWFGVKPEITNGLRQEILATFQ